MPRLQSSWLRAKPDYVSSLAKPDLSYAAQQAANWRAELDKQSGETEAEDKATLSANVLNVVRDSTFARGIADRGLVLDLGRDMEIAFLQTGPNLSSITDHGDTEGVALNPVFTETVRMRMPWPSAVDLAINIIREGILRGSVNTGGILDAIKSFEEEQRSEESSDG
jgi:hypothetical protein